MTRRALSFVLATLVGMLWSTGCRDQARNAANQSGQPGPASTAGVDGNDRKWWKEAIVYQVYPRSFRDSNGDGVGDLKGIISQLDYLKNLGVDVIWLNPIFTSPNDDNGYDISDYRGIMQEFGTMQDFDGLLKGMHGRGLKLVMDLVVNHSSDEHEWFKQSRSSRDNPYRNYYHWWPAEKGKPNPRRSFFDVNGDAWKLDDKTNSYYLHYFSQKQPDLNWEHPKLREEIYSMMRFWFDKGVDGFRMDVIPFISKDTSFPPIPAEYNGDWGRFYANGPHVHQYLREMNEAVLSKYDVMTVAEGAGVTAADALEYVDAERRELNMLYHFEGVSLGYLPNSLKVPDPKGYSLVEFKEIYSKWDAVFATRGWGSIYLGNHDQPRMATRWGNDAPQWRDLSAKMLTTFLLTMRGTPYYYAGDELCMTNIKFDRIEDYRDIESLNWYQQVKNKGGDLRAFLEAQKISARDNSRTPFQWDQTANAGFTTGRPWLKVNPNYTTINAAAQQGTPDSCLNYFRKLVTLRKNNPVLTYGKYVLLDKENPDVYAYSRELDGRKMLVLLNFRDTAASVNSGLDLGRAKALFGNYPTPSPAGRLQPYEAVIYEW
ncbi:MAG TPA: alpha-glucosidase [Vicinamibacterales bacterium]|nr:alpha-glucosidase [Vicinamibacterales bacterium]